MDSSRDTALSFGSGLRQVIVSMIALIILASGQESHGQDMPSTPVFHQDSLISGRINAIRQGPYGFIWIATSEGLLWHDSRDVRRAQEFADGLPQGRVDDLVTFQDRLWIACEQGVFSFDPLTKSAQQHSTQPTVDLSALTDQLYCILNDGNLQQLQQDATFQNVTLPNTEEFEDLTADMFSDGDSDQPKFLGTSAGVFQVTADGNFDHIDLQLDQLIEDAQSIRQIYCDRHGNLWVVLTDRLLLRTAAESDVITIPLEEFSRQKVIPSDDPDAVPSMPPGPLNSQLWQTDSLCFVEDIRGRLWVSDGTQIQIFNHEQQSFEPPTLLKKQDPDTESIRPVVTLFSDNTGTMWVGTRDAGVWKQPVRTFEIVQLSRAASAAEQALPAGPLMSGRVDQGDRIWLGTGEGLIVSGPNDLKFQAFPLKSMSHSGNRGVHSFCELDDGTMLVGTTVGIEHVSSDLLSSTWLLDPTQEESPVSFHLFTSIEGDLDDLMVGGVGGLAHYNGQRWKELEFPQQFTGRKIVYDLLSTKDGLFAATSQGLFRIERDSLRMTFVSVDTGSTEPPSCNGLLQTSRGELYVATDRGVYYRRPQDASFEVVNRNVPAERLSAVALCETPTGSILVADSNGLCEIDGDQARDLTTTCCLVPAASMLSKVIPLNDQKLMMVNLWDIALVPFAGLRKAEQEVPLVVRSVTRIARDGTEETIGGPFLMDQTGRGFDPLQDLSLSSDTTALRFELGQLEFRAASQQTFKVKVEGRIDTWQDASGDTFTLSAVDSGPVPVAFRGTNAYSNDVSEFVLRPQVATPIWKSGWFLGSVVLLFIGAVAVWHSLRKAALAKRQARLNELNASFEQQAVELQTVLNSVGDGVLVTNANDRIARFNPAAPEQLGLPDEKLKGRSIDELFDWIENHPKPIGRGRLAQLKSPAVLKQGDESPIFHVSRATCGAAAASSDVKDVVVVRDVTSQLRHQNSAAGADRESLELLAGGVAHDLTNLLFSAHMYSEIAVQELSRNGIDSDRVSQVGPLLNQASELTKQLLSFSKRSTGEHQPVSVSALLKETEAALKVALPPSIKLECRRVDPDVFVSGDRLQLLNILLNLGLNARDSIQGVGQISMTARAVGVSESPSLKVEPGEEDTIQISVTDTGEGMTTEVKARIFEPYFTTKSSDRGNGLGLATTLASVENHGGRVTVRSTPGEGSTFEVYLPMLREHADLPVAEGVCMQGSGRVLLVDDDRQLLVALQQILIGLGYDVIACSDGQSALTNLSQPEDRFDVAIVDLVMPGLSGRELIQKMKSVSPETPFLVMSSFDLSDTASDLRKEGAASILKKPIRTSDLSKHLFRISQTQE